MDLKSIFSSQNQFTSGGLVLMLVGSVSVLLRSLPRQLWSFLVLQTTVTVTVKDDDAAFQWVKEWFLEQGFLKRVRRVDLDTTLRGTEIALLPAPGTHFFWYQGRPFLAHLTRGEEVQGRSRRRLESLSFQTFGRDQQLLKRFAAEVVASHRRRDGIASSLHTYDDYWTCIQAYAPRLLDSVVLSKGEKEALVEDLRRFRAARQRYRALGVPYHRGYLLYGPPGTGKTSLVSGLAASFGMSIYAVNLTEMNDRSLKTAIHEIPENSVILFEDIDCMRAGHRRDGQAPLRERPGSAADAKETQDRFGVTLGGLLNVLDGFHAPENVVFVMTTNDADALDPALLRPGRIDYKLFMGKATAAQKVELYRRFFPAASLSEAGNFVRIHEAETMAEFQGMLLRLEQAGVDAVAQRRKETSERDRQEEVCDAAVYSL